MDTKTMIVKGHTSLGIELGSTRIKAVLIGSDFREIASGQVVWESHLEDGFWSYRLQDALDGVRKSYGALAQSVYDTRGERIGHIKTIGISAMMHGYIALDLSNNPLVPFRTWRNTTTGRAAAALTDALGFNIPQRWSVAHLYQAILDRESHVPQIARLTTLAGYIHHALTGEFLLGIGDASGMFPISGGGYCPQMLQQFKDLAGVDIAQLLPRVCFAGGAAGRLTDSGAALLDDNGHLAAGSVFCPPEGDAGTGMVATNAIKAGTGNISAGTSIFAMITMERPLSRVYPEIDIVTTPAGLPVAMAHCNSCTADIDAWLRMFAQMLSRFGADVPTDRLYAELFASALQAAPGADGLLAYNYFSGEPIVGLDVGVPLFVRKPDAGLDLPGFMRTLLFSALGTLRIGMDLLAPENIRLETLTGHGGFFKSGDVGQKIMAAALNAPISVMSHSGEGGAWGIAILAAYMLHADMSLEDFLDAKVFADAQTVTAQPLPTLVQDFDAFMQSYKSGLAMQKAAGQWLAMI